MTIDPWGWAAILALVLAVGLRIGFAWGRGDRDRGDLSGVSQTPSPHCPFSPAAPSSRPAAPSANRLTDAQLAEILTELRAGNKIAAIKLYREATGSELVGAKQAIEAME